MLAFTIEFVECAFYGGHAHGVVEAVALAFLWVVRGLSFFLTVLGLIPFLVFLFSFQGLLV